MMNAEPICLICAAAHPDLDDDHVMLPKEQERQLRDAGWTTADIRRAAALHKQVMAKLREAIKEQQTRQTP